MPAIAASAALAIIGDEILAGKVDDINTPFLCRELHALGWQVAKVCATGLGRSLGLLGNSFSMSP